MVVYISLEFLLGLLFDGKQLFTILKSMNMTRLAPCVLQLEYVGWQLNLQMAQSSQARLKAPSAVLQLGLRNEDSEV